MSLCAHESIENWAYGLACPICLGLRLEAAEAERDAALAKLDALERSIADLSHPNMRLLLTERDDLREQLSDAIIARVGFRSARLAALTKDRDDERTARKALMQFSIEHHASCDIGFSNQCDCGLAAALALAAKLP